MRYFIFLSIATLLFSNNACTQAPGSVQAVNKRITGLVGAPCEGCEAIYECPIKFEQLGHSIQLPDWNEKGITLTVSGIVYQPDGKTPAPGVILYVYHTNQNGIYPKKGDETGWGKRHGYIRGWMKTNEKGEYLFKTLRPASYPTGNIPAHIHITIKEPGMNEYWIDDYFFEDDPFLTTEERKKLSGRGGNGIVKTVETEKGRLVAERNIYLGKNIPNYPKK